MSSPKLLYDGSYTFPITALLPLRFILPECTWTLHFFHFCLTLFIVTTVLDLITILSQPLFPIHLFVLVLVFVLFSVLKAGPGISM